MPAHLQLTVTFLDPEPAFHGRGDGGEPEWPPSPLRAFQALVAAAANRFRPATFDGAVGDPLRWLERQPPPVVLCPPAHPGTPVRTAVPNNDLDKWARRLARGQEPDKQPSELKTLKTVRPTWLRGGTAVQYLWRLADDTRPADGTVHALRDLAGGLTHLGWGVNQAVGHVELLDAEPPPDPAAERWEPVGGDTPLRVPRPGTLADLVSRHTAFLRRNEAAGYDPAPPLSVYERVGYRNAAQPPSRPWAAFELLNPDPEVGGRVAFDPAGRTRDVAAWVRHAVAQVCAGWPFPDDPVERFVHGHDGPGPAKGAGADRRFQYLPLPTIERRGDRGEAVGAIRRALVAAPPGCERQVEWVRRRLSGQPLEWDGRVVGLLHRLTDGDWVRRQYTRASAGWSTVTPVVLPGYDDRDRGATEGLLWRAFEQAGLAPEALAGAEAEWRAVGFRAGVEPARRFRVPETPVEFGRWPRYHVRVRFARPVAGPLAVGAGRYRGFGLFAAD